MNKLYITILAFGLLSSCQRKTDALELNAGLNYFPISGDRSWTYQVDSILYDDFYDVVDTVSYQLMEVVQDSFMDNTGNLAYTLYRYTRANEASSWQFLNVWTAQVVDDRAERMEGNQRVIKLQLPVSGLTRWDGNAYLDLDSLYLIRGSSINIYKDWGNFRYRDIDEPLTLGALQFDSTVVVEQVNFENAIEYRYSIEQYARKVGLVYKEMKILDTQCLQYPNGISDCIGVPWEVKAEKGFILKMRLLSYEL